MAIIIKIPCNTPTSFAPKVDLQFNQIILDLPTLGVSQHGSSSLTKSPTPSQHLLGVRDYGYDARHWAVPVMPAVKLSVRNQVQVTKGKK
jgi:hypothetical protein